MNPNQIELSGPGLRSLHSHYLERLLAMPPGEMAAELQRIGGYTFAAFLEAYKRGDLTTSLMPHNDLVWILLVDNAPRPRLLVATLPGWVGLSTEELIAAETARMTQGLEAMLGGAE